MQKNSAEPDCIRVLVGELKLKQDALDAAQMNAQRLIDKSARYKQRAKRAETKQQSLEAELMELRARVQKQSLNNDCDKLIKYKMRAADAVAAREEAEKTCQDLRLALAEANNKLKNATQESNAQIDELTQPNCNHFQEQPHVVTQQRKTPQHNGPGQLLCESGEDALAIDERIDRALHELPLVEDYLAGKLSPIGIRSKRVIDIIDMLPESTRKRMYPRNAYHTFFQGYAVFSESNQHGYTLSPRVFVKPHGDVYNDAWIIRHIEHSYSEKPFEAFFKNNDSWYYIGTYRAFYICDAPWNTLASRWPLPAVDRLVSGTIFGSGRYNKSISGIVRHEYAVGKLVAGYVGMQCVGFDHQLYQELCEAAERQTMATPRRVVKVEKRSLSCDTREEGNKRQRIGTTSPRSSRSPSVESKPTLIHIPS